ncbi:MAG: hypothetical protein EFT35_07835 [Methanophagales archaeon ANME-1-THS]|nr:MAG: hypothetical protein EFT35_07835 [Methanophagales archaeon ANME-1-THS]
MFSHSEEARILQIPMSERIKIGKWICIRILMTIVLLAMTSSSVASALAAPEEKEYPALEPLFSMSGAAEELLNECVISGELKQNFEAEGFPLPEHARLKKEVTMLRKEGWMVNQFSKEALITDEWLIITEDRASMLENEDQIICVIRKENDKLNVYNRFRPVVISCNKDGDEINEFAPGEEVYVKGRRFWPCATYQVLIQDNPVKWWDALLISEDPSGNLEQIRTTISGEFGPTLIWSIPVDAPITHHEYDIIVDKQGLGAFRYNPLFDGLDSATCAGIIAPVPDASAFALFASGLVLVSASFLFGRQRKRNGG